MDKYTEDAASAISSREVSEVLVQITGEAMKQEATMSVALLNQLSEVAQQQVMTNTQLMLESQSREQEIIRNEERFKAEVEQMVADNQAEAAEYQREIKAAYSNMSFIIGSEIKLDPVGIDETLVFLFSLLLLALIGMADAAGTFETYQKAFIGNPLQMVNDLNTQLKQSGIGPNIKSWPTLLPSQAFSFSFGRDWGGTTTVRCAQQLFRRLVFRLC